MKGYIAFTKDHGIHVGRLLVWPALLLMCVFGIFVLVPVELILRSATRLDFPFALLAPAGILFYLAVRTRRAFRGEPLLYNTFARDSIISDTLIIRREESPRTWWFLIWFDIVIYGSAAALLFFVLLAPYVNGHWPPK
jgi:hypothetical protein